LLHNTLNKQQLNIFEVKTIKGKNIKRASIQTAEEAQKRLKEMRSWTSGPFNTIFSWILQTSSAILGVIFLRVLNKVKVIDRHKVESIKPPYIFISNHLTMIDDFLLGGLVFLPSAFRKMKYFPWHAPEEQNFFLGPILTWAMKRLRCVPLTRGKGVFQPGMMRLKELLNGENIIHIYPEGTRSRNGEIGKGKVGVARLAYQTKANIVPCYHEGTQAILPIGKNQLRTGKAMTVIVGDPIDMKDLYEQEEGRSTFNAIADRMISTISNLRTEIHDRGFGVVPIPDNSKEN